VVSQKRKKINKAIRITCSINYNQSEVACKNYLTLIKLTGNCSNVRIYYNIISGRHKRVLNAATVNE